MSGEITAKDLALANFIICSIQGKKGEVVKVSALHFVANQLSGVLNSKATSYKAAFAALWLKKQAPFKTNNLQTALLVGLTLLGQTVKTTDFNKLLTALKSDIDINTLEGYFSEVNYESS